MTENRMDPGGLEAALLQASRLHTRAYLQRSLRHDLQVPLNAMHITLDLLAGKLSALDLVGQRYLRVLEEELQHLSQMLAQAFELPDDEPRNFDLAALLDSLVAVLSPCAARLGLVLQADLPSPESALPLFGRRGWLEQAFLNVAVCRLEGLGSGGHLHIAAEPVRNGVRVVFTDDGPSVETPPDSLESLAARPGDAALGQFVAARVAASFGGSLTAGSGPGGRLCFDLPLASAPGRGALEAGRAA